VKRKRSVRITARRDTILISLLSSLFFLFLHPSISLHHTSTHCTLTTSLHNPKLEEMSTSPPSSRVQTPPSDAVTRSGRSRVPVKRAGYVDSGEIDDSQESGGEEEDDYDDDFVEERKGKRSRSRSSEEDDEEGVDEDSQVSFSSSGRIETDE
jgi:hypothetical protein